MAKKKTANKGKTSKKTSKKVYQTHGKVEGSRPSTLDQVWGDDGFSNYGTLDAEEYKNQIGGMSRAEIQTHATKLSVVPIENRELLERRLVKEFEKHVASYNRPESPRPSPISKEGMKILSEGR